MLEETGMVVGTEKGYAWVETSRQTSCGSCEAKGCGTGALSKVFGNKPTHIKAENAIDAVAGEQVVLGIEESALIKVSMAVYLIPLLALMAGALIGESVAKQMLWDIDFSAVIFAIVGFVMALLWLRRFNRRVANQSNFHVVILRRTGMSTTQSIHFNK